MIELYGTIVLNNPSCADGNMETRIDGGDLPRATNNQARTRMKHRNKGRAFMFGMIFGVLIYAAYLTLAASREGVAQALGWIFFWPQYPVASVAGWLGLGEGNVALISYLFVALYYGYVFLSCSVAPYTAIGGFVISGLMYLGWLHWVQELVSNRENPSFIAVCAGFLFWPGVLLQQLWVRVGVSPRFLDAIACGAVSLTYAVYASGVRTFFLLLRGKGGPPAQGSRFTKHAVETKTAPTSSESAKQFLLAAEAGNVDAQHSLARCFLMGHGVERDIPKASRWFIEAAQKGDSRSQYELGKIYMNGENGNQLPKGLGLIKRSLENSRQGFLRGWYCTELKYNGGDCNLTGIFTDYGEAHKWISLAAKQHYRDAGSMVLLIEKFMTRDQIMAAGGVTKALTGDSRRK